MLASEQHYNCYYLGADVPGLDIVDAALKLKIDIVVLSVLKSPSDAQTMADLNQIMSALQDEKLTIWLAGRGVGYWLSQNPELPANCHLVADLDDFHRRCIQWQHAN